MSRGDESSRPGGCDLPRGVLPSLWEQLLRERAQLPLTVLSGSMAPLIEMGDMIEARAAQADEVGFGDIVVFRQEDRLVAHRIIVRRRVGGELRFVQRGDTLPSAGTIRGDQVVAKVVGIRKASTYLRLDRHPVKLRNFLLTVRALLRYVLWERAAATGGPPGEDAS